MGNKITVDSLIQNPDINAMCIFYKEPDLHIKQEIETDILKIRSMNECFDNKKFIIFYNATYNEIYNCVKSINKSKIIHKNIIFIFLRSDGNFNMYLYDTLYKILKNKINYNFYYYLHKSNYIFLNNNMIYYSWYGKFSLILNVDNDPYKNIIPFSN